MAASPLRPRRIVILGGGTAGWIAASLFARRWPDTRVTLVESPDVPIIGVGEGSTPQFAALLNELGLSDADWMPGANATYKTGIRFAGWSAEPGFDRYFHPFTAPHERADEAAFAYNTRARRTGRDVPAHPDDWFAATALATAKRAPVGGPEPVAYGYHFDAYLVGARLRDHAIAAGVAHRVAHVASVALTEGGRVAALHTTAGEAIAADLFVDASGFGGTIVKGALKEPFLPFAANLFNDRAVTIATPTPDGPIAPETRATALSAGWVWAIPLTNRTGNGYVYASGALSPDAAETELRAYLGVADDVPARHLTMKVGRVRDTWVGNALAIGLAQGFIEPLEATALHLVQATVEGFIRAVDAGDPPATLNRRIADRYEGIRDYIVAHYRMNRRTDTDYWRANAANTALSEPLKAMITGWFRGADLPRVVAELGIGDYYAPMSWHALFAGYGTFPDASRLRPPGADVAWHDPAVWAARHAARAASHPDHRAVLAAMREGR